MSRLCRHCNMSLLALEVTGVDHDKRTGICYRCEPPDSPPWSEDHVLIENAPVAQLEEVPDSNPGGCEFESHREYNDNENSRDPLGNNRGSIKTYCGIYVDRDKARPVWSDEITCKTCKRQSKARL